MPIGATVAVPCGKKTEKRRGRVFPWLNEALHTRLPHAPRKRPQRPNFRRVLAVVIGWYSARRARESPENQGPSPTASPSKRGLARRRHWRTSGLKRPAGAWQIFWEILGNFWEILGNNVTVLQRRSTGRARIGIPYTKF